MAVVDLPPTPWTSLPLEGRGEGGVAETTRPPRLPPACHLLHPRPRASPLESCTSISPPPSDHQRGVGGGSEGGGGPPSTFAPAAMPPPRSRRTATEGRQVQPSPDLVTEHRRAPAVVAPAPADLCSGTSTQALCTPAPISTARLRRQPCSLRVSRRRTNAPR
jgi:hypothetical protein